MHRSATIPLLLALMCAGGALAQGGDDPLWHLDPPSLETILRDGTRDGGDAFDPPGFERSAEPINAPSHDTPAPGGALLGLLAGLKFATKRSRR